MFLMEKGVIMRKARILGLILVLCQIASAAAPVTDGLVLHLDAEAISGLSDGQAVATWADESTAGNNATQSDSGKRPIYKTGMLGGKPIVRFDGMNDYLVLGQPASLEFDMGVDSFTTFVVVGNRTESHMDTIISKAARSSSVREFQLYGDYGISLRAGAERCSYANYYGSYTNAIVTVCLAGHDEDTYRNGIHLADLTSGSGTCGDFDGDKDWLVGARRDLTNVDSALHMLGDIAEVLIYNRLLEAPELNQVGSYLSSKYSIAYTPIAAKQAWQSKPEDGETDTKATVSLQWLAGDFADSHNVYLGTDANDVNSGVGGAFKGNQTELVYYAGTTDDPCGLAFGTTYHWRIDEVNDVPSEVTKGKVWQFRTRDAILEARNPLPVDGNEGGGRYRSFVGRR